MKKTPKKSVRKVRKVSPRKRKITDAGLMLAILDNRYPITIAFDTAIKNGLASEAIQQKWFEDLKLLVEESAKKFTGFFTTASVRKALDLTLGILSLGLMHLARGKKDSNVWATVVTTRDLNEIGSDIISLVKEMASKPIDTSLAKDGESFLNARDQLLKWAVLRDKKNKEWIGYQQLVAMQHDQEDARATKELTFWLISRLTGAEPKSWIRQCEIWCRGDNGMPHPSEVIRTLLFRHCVELPTKGDLILTRKHFLKLRADYQKDPKGWRKKTRARYEEIRALIPKTLLLGLLNDDGKDCMRAILRDGPPVVPSLKDWNDEISIAGITGVFHYHTVA